MKELSIEEKAKAYDDALERAGEELQACGSSDCDAARQIFRFFPELKESEDEKWIPKEIIKYLKEKGDFRSCWIAWLEKQSQTFTKKDVDDAYLKGVCDTKLELEKQGEQILANSAKTCKDEPKFKIGDIIHKIGENTIFPMVIEKIKNGEYVCDNNHSFINIKFQDDYELVEQNPTDRVELVEQKPAWSEDDEKGFGDALWCCKQAASIAKDENDMGNAWYAENWLKSLKDRYTWKPSEEQMEQLHNVFNNKREGWEDIVIESLYNDLKKLREE